MSPSKKKLRSIHVECPAQSSCSRLLLLTCSILCIMYYVVLRSKLFCTDDNDMLHSCMSFIGFPTVKKLLDHTLATFQSLSNSLTFPGILSESKLATVAIQNEMHVISHCNTQYTVTTTTTVFFSRLQWNNSLFLPSAPLEVGPLKSSCKLPQRCLGLSRSRNRIWCILVLKSDIWWQQFQ